MKTCKTLLMVAFVAGLLTASAQAALYLDVVTPSGGLYYSVTSPTQVVGSTSIEPPLAGSLGLNVRIVGVNPELNKFTIRTVSTNVGGGLILGTLAAAFTTASKVPVPNGKFDPDTGDPILVTSFGANGLNSSTGAAADLDVDTDLDKGSTDTGDPLNWMRGALSYGDKTVQVSPDGFSMYRLRFTGTAWTSANPHGVTVIQAINAAKYGWTAWYEGGVGQGSDASLTGKTVTLYRPDQVITDKTQLDLSAGNVSGSFNASASIGSIDEWQWDVNGDGLYESKTAAGQVMTFTVATDTMVTWNDGQGHSGSYMPNAQQMQDLKVAVSLRTKWGDDLTPVTSATGAMTLLLPEPATMALLGLGGLVVALRRRRAA